MEAKVLESSTQATHQLRNGQHHGSRTRGGQENALVVNVRDLEDRRQPLVSSAAGRGSLRAPKRGGRRIRDPQDDAE
eukprot:4077715-Pyramimonas_sp.AAC.1